MTDILFHTVNNAVEFYVLFRYFHVFLGKRKLAFSATAILTTLLLIGYTVINLWQEPLANLLSFATVVLGVSSFYQGNWKTKILYVGAYIVAGIGIELVLFQLFVFLQHDMVSNYYAHGIIATIIHGIVIHLIVIWRKPKDWEIDRSVFYIVSVIWGMILLYAVVFTPDITETGQTSLRWFFLNVMLMILSLLVFWIFEISTSRQYAEKKARELALRMEAQQIYFEQFERYEKEIRRHKHDMKNFLYGVLGSEERERSEKIRKKVKEIESAGTVRYTEHEVIQLLLSTKLEQIEIPNESFLVKCQVPKEIGMENTEIAILLGNLLDNAVEALRQLPFEKRSIHIDIRYTPECTLFNFKNTFDNQHKNVRGRDRGIGQRSIREIVERHEGIYTISTEGEWYRTEIKLPFL